MRNNLKNIMQKIRHDECQQSIGFICMECNNKSYYFKDKNSYVFFEKTCLICFEVKANGILLEDFIFTLSRHIPNHYILKDDFNSGCIRLKEMLKRFTYDNESVLEKLSTLLVKTKEDYFKMDGYYIDIVDDKLIEEQKNQQL